jgi:hypothetical protein
MAKDPSFPFYAQDYLIDTLRWDRAMKSLHVDLMAESWINGPLLDEHGHPFGLTADDIRLWERIKHKWILVDGHWENDKLEKVRENRKKFLESQSEKGRKSAEARKNKENKISGSTDVKINIKQELNSGSTAVEPLEKEKENEKEKEKEIVKGKEEKAVEIILPFKSQKFESAWIKWIKYRKEIGKPYKSIESQKGALKQLSVFDEDYAIGLIERSISNQYQGLIFENTMSEYLKFKNNGQKNRTNGNKQLIANTTNQGGDFGEL